MSNRNKNVFNFVEHEATIDKLIARLFSTSFMSNTKWRKLFTILNTVEPEIQVIWKFVASNNDGIRHSLPPIQSLEETYLNDRFWFGPCYYKEIEWIEFPFVAKPYGKENLPITHRNQNIKKIQTALIEMGEWEMEETNQGLRIYGHR